MLLKIPFRIVLVQLVGLIGLALAYLPFDEGGYVRTYSILLGGLSSMLPSAFMAWHLTRPTSAPGKAFRRLVYGEIGKFAMTAIIFIAVFAFVKPLDVLFFFSSLVISMLFHVFVPLFWPTSVPSDQGLAASKTAGTGN